MLFNIIQRCENPKATGYRYYGKKGIRNYLSIKKLQFLWNRDRAWLLERPSIDRIDPKGNYCIKNCRFIELSENSVRASNIEILQYDLNGNFIKEWESIKTASQYMKCTENSIIRCLKGYWKTAKRFIWKYKNV